MQLGTQLIASGAISPPQLAQALALQSQAGGKLGEVLLGLKCISPLQWLLGLKSLGQPTLSLSEMLGLDRTLQTAAALEDYLQHQFIPFINTSGMLVIASPFPSQALAHHCQSQYNQSVGSVLITPRDFVAYMQQHFGDELSANAREKLFKTLPNLSAKYPITAPQRHGLIAIMLIIVLSFMVAPTSSWYVALVLTSLFYLASLAFKLVLLLMAAPTSRRHVLWHKTAESLSEAELPIYSILVPLYRESSNVLKQILTHIDALDYPKHKLDVWLITEADDPHTRATLQALSPAPYCHILSVPASHPRTKPKACNVALPMLRGELTTIYDAEDRPHPKQLKLAVAAFRHSSQKVACLQASLNYYNRSENMLTQLFAIEYSALFTLFLPALRRLRLPIPLGGTSNHIRTEALRHIHGWDPYNVTEDADLGIRLAYFGYRTDILPSLTLEESPITLSAWLKQRSRWIKGYIQTWLVFMRDPLQLHKALGTPAFFGFQLFVGAPALTFLLGPLFWAVSIVSLTGIAPALTLSHWLLAICSITLLLGLILQWFTAYQAVRAQKWPAMRLAVWLYPFYWILHSIASVKALWQLIKKPHYWEKTTHGISQIFEKPSS